MARRGVEDGFWKQDRAGEAGVGEHFGEEAAAVVHAAVLNCKENAD